MGLRGMIPCRRSDDDGAIRDAAEDALGQRSERSFQGPARPDRRHGSSAGEAGRNDRLPVLEDRFGAVYWYKPGQPPLPTRLMAGLSILKHTHNLSDEELCARFLENPYYQLFCDGMDGPGACAILALYGLTSKGIRYVHHHNHWAGYREERVSGSW